MMQPLILDKNFDAVLVLDFYESFIWTERYSRAGDFEIFAVASKELLKYIDTGYYVYLEESNRLMIIETLSIQTSSSNGNRVKISGRSLESILDRRIVWNQTTLNGYLDGQIKKLLDQNIISPSDSARRIPGFVYRNTDSSIISSMTIRSQYTGDNIYEIICGICDERGIGFKVEFDRTNNNFVFSLYSGTDRSYDQTENEPLEFSPDFDNLIDSNYTFNNIPYRSMALVAGMDQAENRIRTSIFRDESQGLERRELYIDARDLQKDEDTSDEYYLATLEQRGFEKLIDYTEESSFEGNTETRLSQVFNRDYFLGDIVFVRNEYGIGSRCIVTELIRSSGEGMYNEYPKFEMI